MPINPFTDHTSTWGVDVPLLGQIIVSCAFIGLLGLVMLTQPASTYITALIGLTGGIIGFWFGGQVAKTGTQATNGTLSAMLELIRQQSVTQANSVPTDAIPTIAAHMQQGDKTQ